MFASSDILIPIFGSLSGIAALVVAVNTWILRRESRRDKLTTDAGAKRMDTFEISQTSMAVALARADLENERLRTAMADLEDKHLKYLEGSQRRFEEQEDEIIALKTELAQLRAQVKGLADGTE